MFFNAQTVSLKMSRNKVLRITEEERNALKKAYGQTAAETEDDIQSIKDWMKKQPHLPQNEDESRLRTMLYYNKFSLEKTKIKLDMYYSLKHIVPEFYMDREPLNPQMSEHMNNIYLMPLPNLTPELNRVILSRLRHEDVAQFDTMLYLKQVFGMMDLLAMQDTSLADHIILDFQNMTFAHVLKVTPVTLQKAVMLLRKAYSDKMNGFHVMNVPSVAQRLVSFLISLLSDKLAARVYIHKDLQSLKEAISPKVLPNEYGGTAGPLDELYNNWKSYYKSQNDWLKELANKKSDESKRIGEPLDSDMFGMCGSFRKLNYD